LLLLTAKMLSCDSKIADDHSKIADDHSKIPSLTVKFAVADSKIAVV
jgi:hypothetical protein